MLNFMFSFSFLQNVLCDNSIRINFREHYYNFLYCFADGTISDLNFTIFSELVLLNSYLVPIKKEEQNDLKLLFDELLSSITEANLFIMEDSRIDYRILVKVLINFRKIINYYFRIDQITSERPNKAFLDEFFGQMSLLYKIQPKRKSEINEELVIAMKSMFKKVVNLKTDYFIKSSIIKYEYLDMLIYGN